MGRRLQEIYKAYRLLMHRLALDGREMVVGDGELREERCFVIELWLREFGGATDTHARV